ncbi:MAG: TetR/AcrR family transcriptional repressor of nem operon [Planctomycetota bacterium]|jgi:TetR/AcrR family transcriptional repressor of nem operon
MNNRKQQILELSVELLLVKGFCGFSYQDIASELGITKASIHHHFSSKEALGLALCDLFEALSGEITQTALATGGGPKAVVNAFLDHNMEMATMGDRCCPAGILQAEYNSLPPKMQERVDALFTTIHQRVSGMMKTGRELGQFKFEGSPEDQAWLLLSTCQGAMLSARVHGASIFGAVARQIRSSLFA